MGKYSIFWHRRDLRTNDNAGLYKALKGDVAIKPIFIFDRNILDKLNTTDARVEFIYSALTDLKNEYLTHGSSLDVYYGYPKDIWNSLAKDGNLVSVYTNRDYEAYAVKRDKEIDGILSNRAIPFKKYKDQVIFEKEEILKSDRTPYVVFTPYKKKWIEKLLSRSTPNNRSFYFKPYPTEKYFNNLLSFEATEMISLEKMGFSQSMLDLPSKVIKQKIIKSYDVHRDYPSVEGTTKLGVHFRFGTISIREKAYKASKLNSVFLSELIWRDFYSQILQHFPKVEEYCFREKYEAIEWRNNEKEFEAWCNGKTGYPIVDAGMRELNATGFMHNRVRMITASFLTKHLLIDWRWGERYFAEKLLDFDLASNSGGWQWAAGCGTDAAPYFRIFNPYTQATKFDKDRQYIKKWVPEEGTPLYPNAIVDHKFARERCLDTYKRALNRE